jgi:hypothetical protein
VAVAFPSVGLKGTISTKQFSSNFVAAGPLLIFATRFDSLENRTNIKKQLILRPTQAFDLPP